MTLDKVTTMEAYCPHCNDELDLTDLKESGKTFCHECGRGIRVNCEVTYTYTTECLEGEHDLEKLGLININGEDMREYRCKNCNLVLHIDCMAKSE